MSLETRLAWPVGTLLGEGPVWCASEAALRFVDIKGGKLHRFDPATGAQETMPVGGQPSFILPTDEAGFVVGHGHTLRRFDGHSLGEEVVTLDMPRHNRTNDATVDGQGRLWFGTMDDDERRPTGALYRLDGATVHRTSWEAVVTNGPAITKDGRFLYHVDSGERRIWRIPLDYGRCADRGKVFLQLKESDGYPDGVILDSEDCLWVGLWDGWGVRRYDPDGCLLLHVPFPCARVTKLAFGGTDMRTAYVTTATVGLEQSELDRQPLAGSLFAFDAPAAGLILPPVRLVRG